MNIDSKNYLIAATLTIGGLLVASPSFAATKHVGKSGADEPGCGDAAVPCLTIQYAINNSAYNERIVVQPGSYNESLDIDKPGLKVLSFSGRSATVITGSVIVTAERVRFGKKGKGFTIQRNGVALFGNTVKFEGNRISNTTIGLQVHGDKAQVRSNLLTDNNNIGLFCLGPRGIYQDNIADRNETGFLIESDGCTGSSFYRNIARNSDEVGFFGISEGTKFNNNVSENNGGSGVMLDHIDNVLMQGNIISNNGLNGIDAGQSFISDRYGSMPLQLKHNLIVNNTGFGFLFAVQSVIPRVKFENNTAIGNYVGVGVNTQTNFLSFTNNNSYANVFLSSIENFGTNEINFINLFSNDDMLIRASGTFTDKPNTTSVTKASGL